MSYTCFFDSNPVEARVSGHATVVFTKADGQVITIAAGDTGSVSGPIIRVTGKALDGTPTDYTWDANVTFSTSFYIKLTGPTNKKLTFIATDSTVATASTSSSLRSSYTVYFSSNPVQLQVSGGFSTVVFYYATGKFDTLTAGGSGTINGACLKVTGKDSKGKSTDYFWTATEEYGSSILINGTGPTNKLLTFKSTDGYVTTAKQNK